MTVVLELLEQEALEEIVANGKLNIVLEEKKPGEKSLADKVVNLL